MHTGNSWMSLRLAVVLAAAMLLALAATPSVSSASTTTGKDVTQTAARITGALDTLSPGGTTEQTPDGLEMIDDHDDDWGTGWWIVMVIMMVLFWGGVLGVAVWGIRQFTKGRDKGQSPLDIAKERYAKGEITAEEFEKLRRDLG